MARIFAIALVVVSLAAAPATAQGYGVKGKSRVEALYGFVSGGSDFAIGLTYRETESYGFGVGFESARSGGTSATAFTVDFRYYFAQPSMEMARTEPYVYAGIGSIAVSGGGTATGFGAGIGTRFQVSEPVTLRGNVGFVSAAGASAMTYSAAVEYHFSQSYYGLAGLAGSGSSSEFFVGFGSQL